MPAQALVQDFVCPLRVGPLLRARSSARKPWRAQPPPSWLITRTVVGRTGGACTHNMFSSSPSQESLNQFEAPYVNVKTGRMSTTTFFKGEPVLYQAEHKSGRSFFFVYLESFTPIRIPPAALPSSIHTAKKMRSQFLSRLISRRSATDTLSPVTAPLRACCRGVSHSGI